MDNRTLIIRNMVCDRCIAAVQGILERQHITALAVRLGEVELAEPLSVDEHTALDHELEHLGFERLDDRRARIVEQVKRVIIERVRGDQREASRTGKLSEHLARNLNMDYSGVSKLFSEAAGITIERYHNLQRIERAKELLVYDELSLGQIADMLGYSSVQHLSNQFNHYVGFSPTHFKRIGAERRKPLDQVGVAAHSRNV